MIASAKKAREKNRRSTLLKFFELRSNLEECPDTWSRVVEDPKYPFQTLHEDESTQISASFLSNEKHSLNSNTLGEKYNVPPLLTSSSSQDSSQLLPMFPKGN